MLCIRIGCNHRVYRELTEFTCVESQSACLPCPGALDRVSVCEWCRRPLSVYCYFRSSVEFVVVHRDSTSSRPLSEMEATWASARASESNLAVVNRPRAGGNIDEDSSDEDETIFTTAQPEAEMLLSRSSCVECGALRLRRSDMAGMLARADERVLRWHVLEGTRLLCFAPSTTQPRGVISLSGTTVGVEDERTLLLVVATPLASRCYTLRAPDADEQARWLRALRRREGLKLGWLEKRGALNTSFKRRWCQLDAAGERLLYYAAPSEAIECVGLTNLALMEAAPSSVAGGCR